MGCHFLLQCMKGKSESEVAQSYPTLCDPMDCSPPGSSVHGIFQARVLEWVAIAFSIRPPAFSQSLLKFMLIQSMMPSNHLILCHFFLLFPSIFPSIRAFSNELTHQIRCPKDWNFSFSISPFNEYSGLISFRIDWFDLLAVQGTCKSFRNLMVS